MKQIKKIIFLVSFFTIFVSKNYCYEENSMNNLLDILVNTGGGIWVFNSVKNNEYYNYVLQFSTGNKITFSYNINNNNGYGVYSINILRKGTFIIENKKVIINFSTVIGKKYNKPKSWNEPLIENKAIVLEINEIIENKIMVKPYHGKQFYLNNPNYDQSIEKEIEDTEYKIIIKQIYGENIFENNNENMELEFVASKPMQ